MIGTYVAAALICAASLIVGRALLSLAGRREWSWLEPAIGFGAILTAGGLFARLPGHGTSATLAIALLIALAAAVCWARRGYAAPGALGVGVAAAVVVGLVLAIPFAVSGRWGLLGVGFNNDLGLHLAWAEWLRSGFGPAPDPGYPLGPHGLAVATAVVPGINLGQAFVGEIIAIGVMTALTALGALAGLAAWKRVFGAALVAVPYLAASYFAQAAFKETAEALFVLAFALFLAAPGAPDGDRWARLRFALPPLAIFAGIFFAYSFAGLAWPVATLALWSLTLAPVRRALRPRALLRFLLRPLTILALLVLAGLAFLALFGPFGFGSSFNKVAGSNTYGPVSPVEALGIWPASNYRLDAASAQLPGLAGAIAVLALLVGVAWWVRRREYAVPLGLAAGAVLYLASLPSSGDYSQAKALIIIAPLAMLVALRPLLSELRWGSREGGAGTRETPAGAPARSAPAAAGNPLLRAAWALLAVVFCAGAVYSSFLVLRDAPVGPAGHGGQLEAFLPILHGKPVLYAGQDRYAAYELLGADTHVPLVEFPDDAVSPNTEKPFDTGDAYSPIDFDSFNRGTLERFPYVITGRAAWNSQAPPNFKRVAMTADYVLWENQGGKLSTHRHVLLEGTEAGAFADCSAPEMKALFHNAGRAGLFPGAVIGPKEAWDVGSILGTGESTSQTLDLPAGTWNLSFQYFSPFGLTLTAPGFQQSLIAALDGERPNTISLGNNGQFWPAGKFASKGGKVKFTLSTADASGLQSLTGYDGKAYLGELVAVPAEPHKEVALAAACGHWVDWFESAEFP